MSTQNPGVDRSTSIEGQERKNHRTFGDIIEAKSKDDVRMIF